jgi:agmatinase
MESKEKENIARENIKQIIEIKVPGKNGLNMTNGVEFAPNKISTSKETIKFETQNIQNQENQIYNYTKSLSNSTPIFIGGDHSISYPITKALFEKHPNLKLIVLDAHPDLMPPMQNPTHEEWLKGLISAGFKEDNILLIGLRNIDARENLENIKTIPISKINESQEIISSFTQNSPVYLSTDIDFFDESVAPATGYPEKNGANKNDGLKLIKEIIKNNNIIATDVVEVNPAKEGSEKTITLAKKIISTIKSEWKNKNEKS